MPEPCRMFRHTYTRTPREKKEGVRKYQTPSLPTVGNLIY